MRRLRHPNIILFLGAGERSDGTPFIVLEYMEKGSLQSIIDDKELDLSIHLRLSLAHDCAEGIRALHTMTPPRVKSMFLSLSLF